MRRNLDACARLSGELRGPTRHISQWAEISHGTADAAARGCLGITADRRCRRAEVGCYLGCQEAGVDPSQPLTGRSLRQTNDRPESLQVGHRAGCRNPPPPLVV